MDEFGYTCGNHVGYECVDKSKYINSFGYTSEGWKEVLGNCPVSCNFCDGEAFRRLEGDVSEPSCVDTEEYVDEVGDTCDFHVGYDCTDQNTFINTYGFTPEGWKDLLRNCPVSCNLCDSGASRRYLKDDLSSDPCVCMPTWSMSKAGPTCANQQGCPASACDHDPIGPWCVVVNLGCATVESGESWAYCSPGTTVGYRLTLTLTLNLTLTLTLTLTKSIR